MATPYRDILDKVRLAFPQPVSDPIHDSYFIHSIMRALDQVDALKTELPILGDMTAGDFEEARKATVPAGPSSVEAVTSDLVGYLRGMTIFGHPRTQQNVIPPPTIPSVIGVLLAALYNPNIAWDEYSRLVALAEVEAVGMTAGLIGYDPERAGGVFTFGGTGTSLYGVKLGLEKACPDAIHNGVSGDAVILVSDTGHYCAANIAGWLGIGTRNLVTVPTTDDNEIDLVRLEEAARKVLTEGRKIAAIIATMGTTDSFGLDDLQAIAALRMRWRMSSSSPTARTSTPTRSSAGRGRCSTTTISRATPWVSGRAPCAPWPGRAAVSAICRWRIPWAWTSHKTGFAPYISSLVLVKDRADLQRVARDPEQMPYLYHSGEYRPGMYTLETSRAGTGPLAAMANYRLFGRQGLQVVLGHIVEMAQLLREHLEGREGTTVLNRDNFGTVTLFRAYPPGVDTFAIKRQEFDDPAFRDTLLANNEYNRKITQYVHSEAMAGRGVFISNTDCYRRTAYGEPIYALKSYILSPFVDEADVEVVVQKIMEAREKVG